MSASRPTSPAQVIKGKFISATEGFADTFNWIAQTLFNLKAGKGIRIFWADPSHPVIELEETEEETEEEEETVSKTTFNGTDGSTSTSSTVNFVSAGDANVVVTCTDNSSESTDITIGVYYV